MKLICETDNDRAEGQVKQAASEHLDIALGDIQTDFEHGQWWVTQLTTGAQWSVFDTVCVRGCEDLGFEQVTKGDGELCTI